MHRETRMGLEPERSCLVPKNARKVFSCFSCGDGSTTGYKLAGYIVLGNMEVDS